MSCAALFKDEIFILTRKLNSGFPDSECLLCLSLVDFFDGVDKNIHV